MGFFDWMKRLATSDEAAQASNISVAKSRKTGSAPGTPGSTLVAEAPTAATKLDAPPEMTAADLQSAQVGGLNFMEAITAHQKWKSRLTSYLAGTSTEKLDYRVICRDNQCVLGKWINGQGGDTYGHMPVFSQLKMVHGQFHLAAASIVQLVDEGNSEQAQVALRQDYSKHSVKVQGLISTLYVEVTEAKAVAAQR